MAHSISVASSMHDLAARMPSCRMISSHVLRTLRTSERTILSIRWCVVSVGRRGEAGAGDGDGDGDARERCGVVRDARRDIVVDDVVETSGMNAVEISVLSRVEGR